MPNWKAPSIYFESITKVRLFLFHTHIDTNTHTWNYLRFFMASSLNSEWYKSQMMPAAWTIINAEWWMMMDEPWWIYFQSITKVKLVRFHTIPWSTNDERWIENAQWSKCSTEQSHEFLSKVSQKLESTNDEGWIENDQWSKCSTEQSHEVLSKVSHKLDYCLFTHTHIHSHESHSNLVV